MEFVKNQVKEIWADQAFVLSQFDGVSSRMEEMNTQLVALEQVASNFNHFIIEHWIPAQAILVDLHDATCPSCQRANAVADNGHLAAEFKQSGRTVWSLSLCQILNQGKPLPSLVLSPPSSLTPPPAKICCSSLWEPEKGSKHQQGSLYTLTKHWAQCCPSSAVTKGKLEAMETFQRLQKDLGMGVALEAFQKVLVAVKADMYHDAVGCPDCQVCDDWEYCKRS